MIADKANAKAAGVTLRWADVQWADMRWIVPCAARAVAELARSRLRFGKLEVSAIASRNAELAAAPPVDARPENRLLVSQIAFVVPRVARVLPWRSDCLIQATAAQRWLARHGMASRIVIGVERSEEGDFGAHAWLDYDGIVITGGDISRYTVLL